MKKKKTSFNKTSHDGSAISKLVQDFGLLLVADDFERYTMDQSLLKIAQRTRTEAQPNLIADAHLEKFLSVLATLGIEVDDQVPLIEHIRILDRLSSIEAFVKALDKTVDFKIEITSLLKALRRKFGNSSALRLPYRRTEPLISEELQRNCRDIMSIVGEFHVPDDADEIDALWDVNLWKILLNAQHLHSETGLVHHALYERLKLYQAGRGAGSPKVYRRAALAVLLAECFEDFGARGRKAAIHDRSLDADPYKSGHERYRQPKYESEFADFLIAFTTVADIDEDLARDDHSLDKYRKMLRKRAQKPPFRITERIKSSMIASEIELILKDLDQIKV